MKLSRKESIARNKIIQQAHMKKDHQQFLDRQIEKYHTTYQGYYHGTSPATIAIRIGFMGLFFKEASISMKELAETTDQATKIINGIGGGENE